MKIQNVTDRVVLFGLEVPIWSGRKKLRAEDLKLAGEAPPEDLVSLGSKRVCDPEALKIFQKLKKQAERECLRWGTRFLGGYAVPDERAEALDAELERLKGMFDSATQDFLSSYDRDLEAWIASLPRWEAPIRRATEPVNVVGGKMGFSYYPIKIAPMATSSGSLAAKVRGLGDGVFGEVAQVARGLEGSFLGKDVLNRRALGTFKKIRDKLDCLSFVDPRIQPVVDTIDDWARRLPKTGPIEGALFNEGHGLALLLGDPEKLARHGAGQWAVQQGDAPSAAVAEDDEPPAAQTDQSFDDELEALFGDLDDPEPAASEPEAVEVPGSETDAEPATEEEGGQEQDETEEPLIEDPDPNQSFFWDDQTQGATDGDDEGPPAEPPSHTRRESRQVEKSFFF